MQQKREVVTRQAFVQAIREFKKQHQGKLKDLLNKEKHPEAHQAFWNNSIIRNYLSRDAINVSFDTSNRPILNESTTKEEHDKSDHYELKVYGYLANKVLFRTEKMMAGSESEENFYNQGLSGEQWGLLLKLIEQPTSSDVLPSRYVSSCGIETTAMGAIEFFRNMLTLEFQIDKPVKRFHPILFQYPGHVAAALVIMDPSNNRILNAILINTVHINGFWSRNYWLDAFNYRFSEKREFYRSPNPRPESNQPDIDRQGLREHILREFNLDIENISTAEQESTIQKSQPSSFNFFSKAPPNVLINKSTRAACILEIEQPFSWGQPDKKYNFLYDSPEIEKIYLLEGGEGNKSHVKVWIKPRTQVIDASHHLQTADDDGNCALYTLNFVNAIITLLNDPNRADNIYQLALNANRNNKRAKKELVNIFQHDLKALVPFYYDQSSGRPKSPEELKQIHLEQRWNLGGKSIDILYPQKFPPSTSI